MAYRRAVDADLEAEHAVFVAAEGALLERHGFGWTTPPALEPAAPGRLHVMHTDPERCFAAEAAGRVVGYSGAFVRGDVWFLSSLFIDPAYQGRGVGRRLLELALESAPARRLTITDAIQPVSNALYARLGGMLPSTPILAFAGEPSVTAPVDLMASPPTPAALATLDAAAYGFDRAIDHAFWATRASATMWVQDGVGVAYSYRRADGAIGPLAGRDPDAAANAFRAELARSPHASIEIPGTSRTLVATAFAAGLRLLAPPGLLLASDEVDLPRSLAISSYGLY